MDLLTRNKKRKSVYADGGSLMVSVMEQLLQGIFHMLDD
jgi:hypothetical protein